MKSLLLDTDTWDLVVDASGNLAICSEPYSKLQDVATAIRLWLGEVLYDINLGIGYDSKIFSSPQGIGILKQEVERVARAVDGVTSAQCIAGVSGKTRALSGFVRLSLADGTTADVRI